PSRPRRPGRRSTCRRPSRSATRRALPSPSRSQACRPPLVTSRSRRTCQTDAVFSRRLLPALALGGALLLGGCTGDDDSEAAPADDRLDPASQALADAESFAISLTTPELPSGTKGLLSATGIGDPSPAFLG